jgi:hypothetical protein
MENRRRSSHEATVNIACAAALQNPCGFFQTDRPGRNKLFGADAMKNIARYLLLMLVVPVITATLLAQNPVERPTTKGAAAFKQMAALVGEWDAVQDGVPVKEIYTLTANGSTLMAQTQSGKDSPMITMFTVDGDHLIATHYCVAGNQPQMITGVPDDLQKGVTFSLARVMGMKTQDDWHNTGLTIKLDDQNHMTQRWTYLYKGKTGTSVFHYTRKS